MEVGDGPASPCEDSAHNSLLFRDFLLFIPTTTNLRAILGYYSSKATVNQEGDVHINDTMQGLGMGTRSVHCFLSVMASRPCSEPSWISVFMTFRFLFNSPHNSLGYAPNSIRAVDPEISLSPSGDSQTMPNVSSLNWKDVLTEFLSPGYFIAGGLAGMISRTCTAPLDRLKVYLIAQTSNKDAAVEAAKKGSPVKAARHLGQPLIDAVKDLWAAGGIRSLFAGKSNSLSRC